MIRRHWVVPSLAVAALVLPACGGGGGGDDSATTTLAGLPTTVFTTIPPVTAAPSTSAPDANSPATNPQGDYEYTVAAGDYWFGIAQKFPPCTFEELIAYNDGQENIFPGDTLAVPQSCNAGPVTPSGSGATAEPPVTDPITESTVVAAEGSYEVQPGDYWLKIAQLFDCSVPELQEYNGGKVNLFPGEQIAIPPTCASGA
jgi:LysM repeat protein